MSFLLIKALAFEGSKLRTFAQAHSTGLEKKMPLLTRQQVSRVLRELLPRRHWSAVDLLEWMQDMQLRNERAKRSHLKRRLARLRKLSL